MFVALQNLGKEFLYSFVIALFKYLLCSSVTNDFALVYKQNTCANILDKGHFVADPLPYSTTQADAPAYMA